MNALRKRIAELEAENTTAWETVRDTAQSALRMTYLQNSVLTDTADAIDEFLAARRAQIENQRGLVQSERPLKRLMDAEAKLIAASEHARRMGNIPETKEESDVWGPQNELPL